MYYMRIGLQEWIQTDLGTETYEIATYDWENTNPLTSLGYDPGARGLTHDHFFSRLHHRI